MPTIEVKVPSIGDYKDVPVIDVLVKPGDEVGADDPLVTLESDKATMDVPSPAAGKVRELRVKTGDRVSEGSVVLTLEAAGAGAQRGRGGDSDASRATALEPVEGKDAAPAKGASAQGGAAARRDGPRRAAAGSEATEERGAAGPAGAGGEGRGAPSAVEVKVPSIGDYKDVPIIDVLVKPGDEVAADAPLVTLESDKATMDVPSPGAGRVRELKVKTGDRVSEGTVIAILETAGARRSDAEAAAREPVEGRDAAPARGVSGAVTGPEGAPRLGRAAPGGGAAPRAPEAERPAERYGRAPRAEPARGPERPPVPAPAEAAPGAGGPVPHASPSVRKLARELGVDLRQVHGSGPRGRILQPDVQRFVKEALAAAPAARGGAGAALDLPAWPKVDHARYGPVELRPLTRIQRLSGPALARNWVMIPHVTQHDEADITELERFREQLNAENARAGVKVTLLAFVMKACVAALKRHPELNSSLEGGELVVKRYYHLGFAADTPNGLVVPVVKDVDQKGVLDVARELAALAAAARQGKLQAADMQGGSFSVSSLGGIGGTAFTPIINAPEVAILGVSRSATKPVWDGKAFAPRLMLPLSLSYDHRVVDGALAARFTSFLAQVLGDLRRAML